MKFKKIIAVCSAALMLSAVTGCGEENEKTASNSSSVSSEAAFEDGSVKSEETQTEQENSDASQTEDNVIGECDAYKVISVHLGDNVYYPQITGMSDTAVQDKINEKLNLLEEERYNSMDYMRKEAESQYQQEKESGTLDSSMEQAYKEAIEYFYSAYTEVNYADEDILSISHLAFFGTPEEQEARSGGSSGTSLNLDMKTGEELELSDVADVSAFAEKIYSGNGITVTAEYGNPDLQTDFIEEHRIETAQDVREYLDTHGGFSFDENGKLYISLACSKGIITVSEN